MVDVIDEFSNFGEVLERGQKNEASLDYDALCQVYNKMNNSPSSDIDDGFQDADDDLLNFKRENSTLIEPTDS